LTRHPIYVVALWKGEMSDVGVPAARGATPPVAVRPVYSFIQGADPRAASPGDACQSNTHQKEKVRDKRRLTLSHTQQCE
jgi:hypothetical protein